MFAANTYRIYSAEEEHADTLRFLADFASQPPLTGAALIGEIEGIPAAAISLADSRVIADPLVDTDHLAACLRVRAQALNAAKATPSLRERLLVALAATSRRSRATTQDTPGLQQATGHRASSPATRLRDDLTWRKARQMTSHGYHFDPDTGEVRASLSRRDRMKMMDQRHEIRRLPKTTFVPFVDWQTIDWSADRPDIGQAVANGYARVLEAIRNLPEVSR
ncbi:MAG: hypothetical protein WBP81_27135 [Solirubrobacteraceae bacterium]